MRSVANEVGVGVTDCSDGPDCVRHSVFDRGQDDKSSRAVGCQVNMMGGLRPLTTREKENEIGANFSAKQVQALMKNYFCAAMLNCDYVAVPLDVCACRHL